MDRVLSLEDDRICTRTAECGYIVNLSSNHSPSRVTRHKWP
jgi:hypothetical protein